MPASKSCPIKTVFRVPMNICSERRARYKDARRREKTREAEKFVSMNKKGKILSFGMNQ